MAVSTSSHDNSSYAIVFRESTVVLAQQMILQLKTTAGMPSRAILEQILHTLTYLTNLDEYWLETRTLLLAVAPKMEQAGYRREWIGYLAYGVEQSQRHQDIWTEAELIFEQGVLQLASSEYGVARTSLLAAIQLLSSVKPASDQSPNVQAEAGQAKAYNRLAHIAFDLEQPEDIENYAAKALSLLPKSNPERAYSFVMLGQAASLRKQWQEAIGYFEEALSIRRAEANARMIAWNLRNLGVVHKRLGNYETALFYYHDSLTLLPRENDPLHFAATSMNIGNVYMELERFADAIEKFDQSEPIFSCTNDRTRLSMLYTNRGIALRHLQRWSEAERSLMAAINMNQQLNRIERLIHALDDLSLVYFGKGANEKAQETIRDAYSYLIRIENPTIREQLRHMLHTRKQEISRV